MEIELIISCPLPVFMKFAGLEVLTVPTVWGENWRMLGEIETIGPPGDVVMVRDAWVEWDAVAAVPVIMIVKLPRVAEELALTVKFADAPDVTVGGVKTAVTPGGKLPALNVTDWGEPPIVAVMTL